MVCVCAVFEKEEGYIMVLVGLLQIHNVHAWKPL